VRYPLTVGFGTVCIVLVIIGSWQLVHRTAQGANEQLIHTLENQLSEDLIRNLDRFRSAGNPIGIDVANSDVQLDLWFADISEQTGASVAVLWDLEGNVVWSNDRAHLSSDDFEGGDAPLVKVALAGGVITELEHDVQLIDAHGQYYLSDAMETFLPLYSASGDTVEGVLEVYIDVAYELESATMAARSNVLESIIQVMGLLAALLIGSVFVVEVFLHRAYRRRREEEQRRVETDSQLARAEARTREAEIAKHERERFLSIVSHELKTPLTSILAFTDILTRDSDGTLTERQFKHLNLVKRNGRRLDVLIDDVLAVSRIETGRLSLENREFKLSELCWELNQSMASIFETKSQEFVMVHPAGDCAIMADRNRVFQAISNLLSNTSKYSPENTVVSLGCAIEGGSVFIIVTDEGIGLAANDQRHISDLFYRVQNEPTRTVGGLGVGLAIVKAIAEAHGGSVDVVSAPGAGSTFTIEIPGVIASPSGKYPISREAAA